MEAADAMAMMANHAGVSMRNLPLPIAAPSSSFRIVLESMPMAIAWAATESVSALPHFSPWRW